MLLRVERRYIIGLISRYGRRPEMYELQLLPKGVLLPAVRTAHPL